MDASPSRRILRYEKLVMQMASEFFLMRTSDVGRCQLFVSRVICSRDLRNAKVFLHITDSDDPEDDIESLRRHLPDLQRYIHSQVRSKYCPIVHLILDTKYEKALHIEKMLHQIAEERIQKEST